MLISSPAVVSYLNSRTSVWHSIFDGLYGTLIIYGLLKDNPEFIIDMQKVKKVIYPFKTRFACNYMRIDVNKEKYIIQFPSEAHTQQALRLKQRN